MYIYIVYTVCACRLMHIYHSCTLKYEPCQLSRPTHLMTIKPYTGNMNRILEYSLSITSH